MRIITDITEKNEQPVSIALGTFDGVHIGHRAVIGTAVPPTAVFTFSQSPAGIITGEPVRALTTERQKLNHFKQLGVSLYISLPFTQVRNIPARSFVAFLKQQYNAASLCCGFNFRFGAGGEGDARLLSDICRKTDIEVKVTEPVLAGGEPVSSTRIRALIENGDMKQAARLLGCRFELDFTVERGDGRGGKWGLPTINQRFEPNFVLPRFGVYLTETVVCGKKYKSVTNIGVRPTFKNDFVSAETFIIGFSGELYGQRAVVRLYDYLREERRFTDKNELVHAIRQDIAAAEKCVY